MKKSCWALALLVFLWFIDSSNIHAESLDAAQIKKMMLEQESAVEAYGILMNSFDAGMYQIVYPDEYAGAYVDDNNMLAVLLAANSAEIIS